MHDLMVYFWVVYPILLIYVCFYANTLLAKSIELCNTIQKQELMISFLFFLLIVFELFKVI